VLFDVVSAVQQVQNHASRGRSELATCSDPNLAKLLAVVIHRSVLEIGAAVDNTLGFKTRVDVMREVVSDTAQDV
jgi:hypothetical protein